MEKTKKKKMTKFPLMCIDAQMHKQISLSSLCLLKFLDTSRANGVISQEADLAAGDDDLLALAADEAVLVVVLAVERDKGRAEAAAAARARRRAVAAPELAVDELGPLGAKLRVAHLAVVAHHVVARAAEHGRVRVWGHGRLAHGAHRRLVLVALLANGRVRRGHHVVRRVNRLAAL